ncbi:MAG TPA: polysaccharide pyruvyl transferase family protein [Sphingomicrobium sp.]
MRALVIGHFSTIGDIESLDYVRRVLETEGIAYDILPYNPKYVPFIDGSVLLRDVSPAAYTHLIAVCGPLWPEFLAKHGIALDRFSHCTRIGLNLTMIRPLEDWDPFHLLIERDSGRTSRPDITFLEETRRVPVAGLCTIARQREYGSRQRHREAIGLMKKVIRDRKLATVEIDTRWPEDRNSGSLGSPEQVISVIGKMDVVLTNRLHGMVYTLKAGVPALAIDPVEGGDKVTAQAQVLGWPAVSTVAAASPEWIDRTLDWCLSKEGRDAARLVANAARSRLQPVAEQFREALHAKFDDRPVSPAQRSLGSLARGLLRTFRRHPA